MQIFTPTNYDIEFSDSEIETLKEASKILNDLILKMTYVDCSTIEGGYEDCPYTFDLDNIRSTLNFLNDFTEYVPYKVY